MRRMGFAVAPEFGGTIHGYCGDTLDASLLDILEWHRKPCLEDMQKAYVGKSRARKADQQLIVQPYSPHLFRQGQMPGPTILMQMLRREITTNEAKQAWRDVEKTAAQKDTERKKTEQKWLRAMPLPCRDCSNDEDQTTWKPIRAFGALYTTEAEIWKEIVSKGQDLQCSQCARKAYLLKCRKGRPDKETYLRENPMMHCSECNKTLHYTKFSESMHDLWLDAGADLDLSSCKQCERGLQKFFLPSAVSLSLSAPLSSAALHV